MAEDVEFRYAADGKAAESEITRLEKRIDKLQAKQNQGARVQQSNNRRATDGLRRQGSAVGALTTRVGTLAKSYLGLTAIITALAVESRKATQALDEAGRRGAEEQLRLAIQSGLTPSQVRGQLPRIEQQLLRVPSTDVSGALAIQTQLFSSGIRERDIRSGEALGVVLELLAASNQFGEAADPASVLRNVVQFTKAQGIAQPSAADIRRTGVDLVQLFRGSDIQAPDLQNLARVAAGLRGAGVTPEQQLASFSVLRDISGPQRGASGLQRVVSALRAIPGQEGAQRGARLLGLSPDDIDLIGESLPEALQRLRTQLQAVDPKRAASGLVALFGKEGQADAQALIDNLDKVIDRERLITRDARFAGAVSTFGASRFAQEQRLQIEAEFANRRIAEQTETLRVGDLRIQRDLARARDRGDILGAASARARGAARSIGGFIGGETGAGFLEGIIGAGAPRPSEDALRENTAAVREQTDEMKRRRAGGINPNAQVEGAP